MKRAALVAVVGGQMKRAALVAVVGGQMKRAALVAVVLAFGCKAQRAGVFPCADDSQCPTGAHCEAGRCESGAVNCPAGQHRVGPKGCADDKSVLSCGGKAVACPVPEHASATCDGAACGYSCAAGFAVCAGGCCPGAPGALRVRAGTNKVTIAWDPVPGATSYTLELSSDGGSTWSGFPAASPFVHVTSQNGTPVPLRLRAVDAAGPGAPSPTATATPIAIPAGVTVIASTGKVTLQWQSAAGATGYVVYRSDKAGAGTSGTPLPAMASPFDDTPLPDGVAAYYVVTGVNDSGESDPSDEASATPLAAPIGLAATSATGSVTLTWPDVAGAEIYDLYRSTTSGAGPSGTQLPRVTSPWVDSPVPDGAPLYYILVASNAAGSSDASPEVAVVPLDAPSNLTAVAGTGRVRLAWTAVPGATSYDVLKDAAATPIANVDSPNYLDAVATNGVAHAYAVVARDFSGASAASSTVSATPLAAPAALTAFGGTQRATLTWPAVAGAQSYALYRSPTSGSAKTGTRVANVTSPYADASVGDGVPVFYAVVAVPPGLGESDVSPEASTTPLDAPTGLAATAGNAQAQLAWSPSQGATGYAVYWSKGAAPTKAAHDGSAAATATSATVANLTNGAAYQFAVSATTSTSESDLATPAATTPLPPPAAPATLTATPGNAQVTLTFPASSGATSYNAYWVAGATVSVSSGTKLAGIASGYLHTGLTNGTQYAYVVTAVGPTAEGAPSSVATATPEPPAPAAPTGVIATAGDAKVTVAWTGSAGATGYNLYWSAVAANASKASGTKIAGVSTGAVVASLTNGTPYYFVVTAVNGGGESAESSPTVTATPRAPLPAPPSGVVAAAGPADAQVTVTWQPSNGATQYNVYWAKSVAGATKAAGTSVTNVTSPWLHKGLVDGTTYSYVVTAQNQYGESAESSPVASATPALQPNSWGPRAPETEFLGGSAVVGYSGKLYALGGGGSLTNNYCSGVSGNNNPSTQAYDPSTGAWKNLACMPGGSRSPGRYGGNGAAVVNGNVYVPGGWTTSPGLPSSDLFIYNVAGDSWSSGPSMPYPYDSCGSSVTIGTKVYVYTTCNGNNGYANSVYVFDTATNAWSTGASPPHQHASNPASGVINGKWYLIGGSDGACSYTCMQASVDVYDPASGWSTQISKMPTPRGSPATGVINGKLYVAGGNDGTNWRDLAHVYDPVADSWTPLAAMSPVVWGGAGDAINGILYVLGTTPTPACSSNSQCPQSSCGTNGYCVSLPSLVVYQP